MAEISDNVDVIKSALRTAISSFDLFYEQLSSFFSALPDPVFVINQEGFYIKNLGGNARHLYQDGRFLEGKNIRDIFVKESADKFLSAIKEAIDKDSLVCIEYEINLENRNKLTSETTAESEWYEGRIYPIKEKANDLRSVIWYAINITEKKSLEKELKILAETDPLTGAYNRRYLFKILNKEFSLSKRYHTPFSLLLMDIDYFKKVNDSYGHHIGDMVLKELVNICTLLIRDVDVFARFGGEEFAIMLPNTAIGDAFTTAERVREEINKKVIKIADGDELHFSVSIGVSEISISDKHVEDVAKRADLALYQAKESGRNRVCLYEYSAHNK